MTGLALSKDCARSKLFTQNLSWKNTDLLNIFAEALVSYIDTSKSVLYNTSPVFS